MINHMRTLLMNRSQSELSGFAYVPPEFTPLDLVGPLDSFRNAVVPSVLTPIKLLLRVHTALKIADVPELTAITGFDNRNTYELSDVRTSNPFETMNIILRIAGTSGVENTIFSGHDAANALYEIYSHTPEQILKAASCIHAYAASLEKLREG